jgi:proteasome lid subunit RPN8/RPN11
VSAVFHARGATEPAVTRLDRDKARARYRVYRARGGLEVAVPEHLVERGVEHCRRVRPLEWYGALVATRHEDDLGRHIVVRGLVLDPSAKATSSRVESTTASEATLRRVAALYYPDAHVIGWCHGHPPGIGAFYSSTDRENQSSWAEPDAIGIVFEAEDPKQLAVFRGPKSEELVLVSGDGAHGPRSVQAPGLVSTATPPIAPQAPAEIGAARPAAGCDHATLDLARRALRLALVATAMACVSPVATLLAARGATGPAATHGSVVSERRQPEASTDASAVSSTEVVARAADVGSTRSDASSISLDAGVEPTSTPDAAFAAVEVPDAALDATHRRPRSRAAWRRPAPPDRVADQP